MIKNIKYYNYISLIVLCSVMISCGTTEPKPTVPSGVNLSSPSPSASLNSGNITFSWASVNGATGYRLQVSTDSDFSNYAINKIVTGTTYSGSLSPTTTTTYYWRVQGSNSAGAGAWSEIRPFTINVEAASPPDKITLLSPGASESLSGGIIAFSWMSDSKATDYRLHVSTDSNFSSFAINQNIKGTAYSGNLSPSTTTTYYWRVQGYNSAGDGPWSEVRPFTIGLFPDKITLLSPIPSASLSGGSIAFSWVSDSEATDYRLQVSTDNNFSSFAINESVTDTTYSGSLSPSTTTTYYWRVQGSNSAGDGSWSEIRPFTVEVVPDKIALSSPGASALLSGGSIAFSWMSVNGATSYSLQVSTDSSFSSFAINQEDVTDTTYSGSLSPSTTTTYYWRVQGSNSAGDGAWSEVRPFTIGVVVTLTGHSGEDVNSVAYSPDGSMVASGSNDNTIRLWQVSDGTPIRTLTGHSSFVISVAFSPDGSILASGSGDNDVRLWQVSDGSPIDTLTGHSNWVWSVAFSPDGSVLASGSRDNTIRLWQVSDGSPIDTLTGHSGNVHSVAFSPDGSMVASGSDDDDVILWQVSDGSEIRTLTGHSGNVNSVAFSPDGSMVASGSDDDDVILWQVSDGTRIRTLTGHSGNVQSVAFSPDSSVLASGSYDDTIRLWRVSDGTPIRILNGHSSNVRSVAFSPDGSILASGSSDNTVKLWPLGN